VFLDAPADLITEVFKIFAAFQFPTVDLLLNAWLRKMETW